MNWALYDCSRRHGTWIAGWRKQLLERKADCHFEAVCAREIRFFFGDSLNVRFLAALGMTAKGAFQHTARCSADC